MIDSRESYYKKVTNKQNHKESMVRGFKSVIEECIKQTDSPLVSYLVNLSKHDKARLISALLQNNRDEIKLFLLEPIREIYPSTTSSTQSVPSYYLDYIAELTDLEKRGPLILSGTVLLIIDAMLYPHDDKNTAYIIKNAMQLIPDTLFPKEIKLLLAECIESEALPYIDSYAYTAPITPLDKNQFEGDISKEDYKAICSNDQLDISEFIINTLGVLQSCMKSTPLPSFIIALNNIRQLYNNYKYAEAIAEIKNVCHQFKAIIDPDLVKFIVAKSQSSHYTKPNMTENIVRQYYENCLARLALNNLQLGKINEISKSITGITVSGIEEIPALISAAFMVKTGDLMQRQVELMKNVKRTSEKNPSGFFATKGDEVKSQTPGVIAANQSNFLDQPSVHSFYLIALLEKYMKNNFKDYALQDNINEYVKAFIISFIIKGYENYQGMTDAFKQPQIIDLFKQYKVTLNLSWLPSEIEQATKDTQEYSQTRGLQKLALAETPLDKEAASAAKKIAKR